MRLWKATATLAAIGGMGAAILFQRRKPSRVPVKEERDDSALVDEAGLESFPASDPPGWTLG